MINGCWDPCFDAWIKETAWSTLFVDAGPWMLRSWLLRAVLVLDLNLLRSPIEMVLGPGVFILVQVRLSAEEACDENCDPLLDQGIVAI